MIPKFDKGVETVTLTTLKSTREYEQGRGGRPRNLPKIHFRIFDDVQEVLAEEHVAFTSPDVFIHESQSSRLVDSSNPSAPAEFSDYLIQRVCRAGTCSVTS